MLLAIVESIGRQVILWMENSGRIVILLGNTLFHLREKPRINHVLHQMAHLGVDSLPIVLLTILFTGMVITLQTATEFIKYGAQSSVGGVVAIAMARELAPVLTGVVVAGRVGAAITAEIGSMKVTEQIDALRVMAINPIKYLVVPRLLACVIMVPILVIFADVIGTIGGYLVATLYAGISSFTYINSITIFTVVNDIMGGLIKAMFFGGIIAIIGCYKGLTTGEGAEGVGRATTASVVSSIILIFISNYFLSLVLYR
ncbi:MlaE family ABC transporter permease [Pelosinus propionicus]|uniref:Phospholipid/cholesterol/gamma-HCH transport system permease protein n=1 Tax=Pelosinus propionicus DSM 13327 TaxID=1123291 RepID=A0A1I4J730_9FIRM|nr:ABC transporter permease [Pelosinus propionicus]SFL62354.1 phospholipid/cholesterol/gamma-HCH transport system permease protein [Pelosinus propionicus DSM 13327]